MSNSKRYPCRCLGRVPIKSTQKQRNGDLCKRLSRECGARRSLRRHPSNYIYQPACPSCGSRSWSIDWHRLRKEMGEGAPVCMCSGLHHLHRKGCKYCEHNTRYAEDWALRDRAAKESGKEVVVGITNIRELHKFYEVVDELNRDY